MWLMLAPIMGPTLALPMDIEMNNAKYTYQEQLYGLSGPDAPLRLRLILAPITGPMLAPPGLEINNATYRSRLLKEMNTFQSLIFVWSILSATLY